MKRLVRFTLFVLAGLLVLGLIAYRVWFHNPYEDTLHLDPQSIFSDEVTTNGLFLQNAILIDVESGTAIPNSHVVIRGDSIVDVLEGENPDVPDGMEVYDARDKFIMPGLIDVHVHLAMHWHLISGDFSPRDSLVTRAALEQFVRYGVTTVLTLGGGGANDEQVVELKQMERNNAIISPLLFAAGNQITAPGSHPITTIMRLSADTGQERLHQAGVITIAEDDDPLPIVENKKRLGLDGVKIIIEQGPPPFYPNPRMSAETASKILKQATELGLPVYAHTESYDEFTDAVNLGVHGVMHSVLDTLIRDPGLIERMKQEGIWYVPTLSIFYGFNYLDNPERLNDDFLQAGVSKRVLKGLEHPLFRFGFGGTIRKFDVSKWLETSIQNLKLLQNEGVKIALGTDASTPFNFPGYNAHIEMELMTHAGLSNAEVLRIATIHGAGFLGIEDQAGTIAGGKVANLIVLKENPLADIRNTRSIEKVILKGRVIDPVDQTKATGDK